MVALSVSNVTWLGILTFSDPSACSVTNLYLMPDRPPLVQRFDTEHLPPEDRFAYWADEFGKSVGYVGLESPQRDDFHQWLGIVDISSLTPSTFEGAYAVLESFFGQHRIPVPERVAGWGAYRFVLPLGKADVAGDEVKLRPIEFDLAMEIFRNIDRPLTREWLWSTVWERGFDLQSRSLDTNMSCLRRKLGLHTGKHGLSLQSIWGTGYQLSQAARAL